MSTDTLTAPPERQTQPPVSVEGKGLITISVERLAVGRQINNAIYDPQGMLLLPEGSLITPRFKDLLTSRKIQHVQIHEDDGSRVVVGYKAGGNQSPVTPFETELTRKLDAIVDSGQIRVANTEQPVRERTALFGRQPYDQRQRQRLLEQFSVASKTLTNLLQTAMCGSEVSGQSVSSIANGYITELMADTDHVLAIAAEVRKEGSLTNHFLQLSLLGMAIGIEMGLDETNVRTIGICGLIHDWGMTRVPQEIRNANRLLTAQEFVEIQKHAIYSLELARNVSRVPSSVPLVCYQVHEKLNGSGYPRGREGNSIHLFARILNVADTYLALTSNRPYRPALMSYAAMECLLKHSQKKLIDPNVVRSLLHVISLFPVGSFVRFVDGTVARVLRRNGNQYASPIVQLIEDGKGNRYSPDDPHAIVSLGETQLKVEHAMPTPGQIEVALSDAVLNHRRE